MPLQPAGKGLLSSLRLDGGRFVPVRRSAGRSRFSRRRSRSFLFLRRGFGGLRWWRLLL
jgi:hypothetical protein